MIIIIQVKNNNTIDFFQNAITNSIRFGTKNICLTIEKRFEKYISIKIFWLIQAQLNIETLISIFNWAYVTEIFLKFA